MNTQNSSQKVAFCKNFAGVIGDTRTSIDKITLEIESISGIAKMSATDKASNAVKEVSNLFNENLTATCGVLEELLDTLAKATYIGQAFVDSAKKAKADVEAVSAKKVYEFVKAERAGEEIWNNQMAGNLEAQVKAYTTKRVEYINELAQLSKGIDDEEFTEVVRKIGSTNEKFTNDVAVHLASLDKALEELGITISSDLNKMKDTASSLKFSEVGSSTINLIDGEEA